MFLNDNNRDVLGDTEMLVSAADQPRRAFNFALTINTIWSAALNDRSVRRAPLTRILTTPLLHDFLSVTDGKGNALGRVVCVAPGILGIPASRVDGVSTCSLLHSCFGLWEQERSWNSPLPPLCIPQPWLGSVALLQKKPGNTTIHKHTHRAYFLIIEHVYVVALSYRLHIHCFRTALPCVMYLYSSWVRP